MSKSFRNLFGLLIIAAFVLSACAPQPGAVDTGAEERIAER